MMSIGRADSTVVRQRHSINKGDVLTREKRNYACDFIRCSGSTDRKAISKRCHYRFAFLKIGGGLTRGGTRGHGVDPYAARAVPPRQGAREVRDGALCRVVGTQPHCFCTITARLKSCPDENRSCDTDSSARPLLSQCLVVLSGSVR